MSALESRIDDLYRGSPEEFVAARNALAKSLSGDEARRVKQLARPTVVAWAVNQLYWQQRPTYDRLIKSGKRLRTVQIHALGGRSVDVRSAVEDHRASVAQAVADATQLASRADAHPNADELSRTFEALSLEVSPAEDAGRLSKALQPAGFEALAGIVVKAPVRSPTSTPTTVAAPAAAAAPKETREGDGGSSRRREAEQHARERREAAAAEKQKAAAIARAKDVVVQAQAAEGRAKSEWEQRKRDREEAEAALTHLEKR